MSDVRPSRLALALIDRAAREPDRDAAWDVERRLSYDELEALVATLATRIRDRHADLGGCGVLPLLVDRSVRSVIAVNAALRAGVPFTPVDADLAPGALARLLRRIDDPGVLVLCDARRRAAVPGGVRVIEVPDRAGERAEPVAVDPGSMARLIFTSGSSGEPKGVMTSWRSLDGNLDDPMLAVGPDAGDVRVLGAAPFSFAAGVISAIRPALGVAVSVVDPNAHDPLALLERIDADRLNSVALVPSHLATVLDRWPSGRRLESVRTLMSFGEPLEWAMVPTMRRLLTDEAFVVNVYGATEGGRPALALRIGADLPLGTGRVPLGRVLDPAAVELDPVGDGLREIVSRGPSVALGYWRDPELTARVFGQDEDGTRWWRSGDLVRQGDDGLVHFAGRRDNVVKINGRLVEPSEPERVLGEIDGIRRAVVLVQSAPRGGHRLVAHVEVDEGAALTPAQVRRRLVDAVAAHLVPTVIVRHERLPVTDRGKLDRRALLDAEPQPWVERRSERSPMAFERALLDVVGGIVGHRGVGPDDDLWDAGLDSLGATELLSALEDFGWPTLPESILLDHRTVASLDALRTSMLPTGDTIWLNRDAPGDPVVCVLTPAADALTFRRFAQELSERRPVAIVRQFDPTGVEALPGSVPQIAEDVADRIGPELAGSAATVVGYSASGVVAHEVARALRTRGVRTDLVLLDTPAGAASVAGVERAAPAVGRRLRRAARQAWMRALPATTMPVRERAYARFEQASALAERHRPTPDSVPTTLYLAVDGQLSGLAPAWREFASDLTVLELDCSHEGILDVPHISTIAARVAGDRGSAMAPA